MLRLLVQLSPTASVFMGKEDRRLARLLEDHSVT
jgi:hypothetical protein